LKAKKEKVVKNLGRFGFFILGNKNRMSLMNLLNPCPQSVDFVKL